MSRSRKQAFAARQQANAARNKAAIAARQRRRNRWISLAVVAVLVIAGLVGWGVYQSQRDSDFAAPAHVTSDQSGLADGDGPVTVEIWLDLHCPHCRTFEEEAADTLDRLVAEGAITRVYHPVAFLDRFSTTAYSTRAASSVGCAADGDAHVAYTQALLAEQPPSGGPALDNGQLVGVGATVGLTGSAFTECVNDQRYRGWVDHVTAAATRAGVTGTPTVRVDGTQVEPSVTAITAAVQAAAGAGS
jgi:protein-disulfide isomerase